MNTARQEWAEHWPLPFVAMLGVAGSTIFPYASGVLMEPLTQTFGWTRSQFSFPFLLQAAVGLVAAPLAGRLIDRYGPRRVLLTGIPIAVVGMSMLGLVGRPIWSWWVLAVIQGALMALILPVGWITTVIRQFHVSRGLALAIALAGVGLGAAIWPVLAALTIYWLGWRAVFPVLGVCWGLVVLPLTFLLIASDRTLRSSEAAGKPGSTTLRALLWSRKFLLLAAAGSLFIATIYGFNLNLVPILKGLGYSVTEAAGIAGLAGVTAVIGRILIGLLLDHLPTKPLGTSIFLVPIAAAALFLSAQGTGWMPVLAVVLLGLSLGAETDIIAYIASREFDRDVFASAFSVVSAIFSVSAGLGPLLVSALYDASHSYDLFLAVSCLLVMSGAALLALVPMDPDPDSAHVKLVRPRRPRDRGQAKDTPGG